MMQTIVVDQLQAALIAAGKLIVKNEPLLTEIDSIIGDGDHGTGMETGFSALQEVLSANQYEDIYSLMRDAGITLVKTMGGASGVIFGTLLIAGHDCVRGLREMDADGLIAYFDAGAVSIAKRGRTSPGDKTMLDALLPAIDAMRQMRTKTADIGLLFQAAYEGALQGVEATKAMLPRKGRSKNFREKALGLPDPGAVSVSLILKGMSESVNSGAIPQF